MTDLHIPEGINYECTGCGKCCGGWAVPLTEDDYLRISPVDWGQLDPKLKGKKLFRKLKDYEKVNTPYSHAIVHAEDGFCPFLENNLCFIHKSFDSKFKPAMCQQFPYGFNETPSGIYATVNFYSMAVIYNSGQPLSDQKELLLQKWQDFQALYPDHHPNWSQLKLTIGQPMTWEEYIGHEKELLKYLKDNAFSLEERLIKGSQYLSSKLSNSASRNFQVKAPLKKLDKHLLVSLHKIYFPSGRVGRGEGDFNIGRFIYQLCFQGTRIALPGCSFKFEDLCSFPWPDRDPEIEDLLYRYLYSRIFGKLYFGAGFGQLSLIAGFHHLALVMAIVKLQAKASAKARQAPMVSLLDVQAAIRLLEKRLGETKLGGYEAAVWELLMSSPSRVDRVLSSL